MTRRAPSLAAKRHGLKLARVLYRRSLRNRVRGAFAHLALSTPLVYGDRSLLSISPTATINNALLNLMSGRIEIQAYVMLGHNVCLLTGTHPVDRFGISRLEAHSTGGRDIIVEEGAWIASNATVLGGCRIGKHSVVAAGSVVTHDVNPYTLVAGVPARTVRNLSSPKN